MGFWSDGFRIGNGKRRSRKRGPRRRRQWPEPGRRGACVSWDLERFDVEFLIAKETVLGLFDSAFLGEWAELPVNVDQTGFRQVFEGGDDPIPELTGSGPLNL